MVSMIRRSILKRSALTCGLLKNLPSSPFQPLALGFFLSVAAAVPAAAAEAAVGWAVAPATTACADGTVPHRVRTSATDTAQAPYVESFFTERLSQLLRCV